MGVRLVPVSDVLQQVRRTTPVSATETYPMVGARNFARGTFDAGSLRGTDTKYREMQLVKAGDLIYPKLGAWEGAFSFVDLDLGDRYASPEYCVFTICSAEADAAYLRHLFAWEPFWRSLAARSTGTNVRRRRLQPGAFLDGQLPLPDIPEQQRIAGHLDRIGETSHVSTDLDDFELTWRHLVERLTFGSHIPPQRLGDVLQPKVSEWVEHNSDYQIAGVYSFGRGLLSRGAIKGADTKYKSFTRLDHNDVVYSKLGAFEGAVAVVPVSYGGFYVSPEFPVFEVDDSVDTTFLRYCVIAESFVRQLFAASSGVGARQKRVSPGAFLDLSVPIPSLGEQREIARRLDLASRALELKRDAVRIRKALLPAARNDAFTKLT